MTGYNEPEAYVEIMFDGVKLPYKAITSRLVDGTEKESGGVKEGWGACRTRTACVSDLDTCLADVETDDFAHVE